MKRYFEAYRSLAGTLDKAGIINALENGVQGRMLPFRSLAESFHLIDDETKTVYIPRDKGAALVQRLQAGERSRELFRKLGQYSVNIYDRHFQALMNQGAIKPVDEASAILLNPDLYNSKIGLTLNGDTGTGLLI